LSFVDAAQKGKDRQNNTSDLNRKTDARGKVQRSQLLGNKCKKKNITPQKREEGVKNTLGKKRGGKQGRSQGGVINEGGKLKNAGTILSLPMAG